MRKIFFAIATLAMISLSSCNRHTCPAVGKVSTKTPTALHA